MAVITALAIAAVGIGAASYVSAEKNRREAKAAYAQQADAQNKSNAEQRALNAQSSANERRQQIREERVRRARLLQASENTGVSESSGVEGAMGGFATQLGANIGTNLGRIAGADRMSQWGQKAADFGSAAQNSLSNMQANQNLFGLSMSIFNAAGGMGAFKSAPAAKV